MPRRDEDKRIKTLDELRAVCTAIHRVWPTEESWEVCECEGNPTRHACSCKGFKGYGICSHVLALNHILKKFNVRHQVRSIGKRTTKTAGGNTVRPLPALVRAPTRVLDSSDEEEEGTEYAGIRHNNTPEYAGIRMYLERIERI